ncbi:hypothetical protein HanXRQr2_Chr16g0757951 [Helianthus annuus]|uniref:Uncharacterized protein n=1 Tax=Helianthus annuus TaxID=4232 RepID=A0A9K3GZG1_HELAN|nr:hypothetical protein HanXRQr2_Chr16g0757951 [Helianthus annuus]
MLIKINADPRYSLEKAITIEVMGVKNFIVTDVSLTDDLSVITALSPSYISGTVISVVNSSYKLI